MIPGLPAVDQVSLYVLVQERVFFCVTAMMASISQTAALLRRL
jgi:hypothetical protein